MSNINNKKIGNMILVFKILLVVICQLILSLVTYSANTIKPDKTIDYNFNAKNFDEISKDNVKIAENINIGFRNGSQRKETPEYMDFIAEVGKDNYDRHDGLIAVRKRPEHTSLVIGHSIVSIGSPEISKYKVDVVGLAGALAPYVYKCKSYLNKSYKKVYVWVGVNDVTSYKKLGFTALEVYNTLKEDIDEIYNTFSRESEVIFMRISPTSNFEENLIIDKINNYISNKYNYFYINFNPDLDEYHYTLKSVSKICAAVLRKEKKY